jgi:hypothetical protein
MNSPPLVNDEELDDDDDNDVVDSGGTRVYTTGMCEPSTTNSNLCEAAALFLLLVLLLLIDDKQRGGHRIGRLTCTAEEGIPCLPRPRIMWVQTLLLLASLSLVVADKFTTCPSGQDTENTLYLLFLLLFVFDRGAFLTSDQCRSR